MNNASGSDHPGTPDAEFPQGWRWYPELSDDGEAKRLLQRNAERGLPEEARAEVEGSALEILARCVPPHDGADVQETGLVVGYVQSGKTLSFTTVAALACDNGYPLVVVLSGTKTNLYGQTVKRLRRDLDLDSPAGRWAIFEAQTNSSELSQQLNSILEQWDKPALPGFPRQTAIITVLKNARRVEKLVDALKQLDLTGRSCIIIDDEADQHGLNTKARQNDTSAVYSALLSLRDALPRHTYVQYTATPQALLLIRVFDSLSPRFGWVIAPGSGYCGGQDFFDSDGQHLIRIIPDADLDDFEDDYISGPPASLLEALRIFYVGVAAQAYRRGVGERTQEYRSMLVHPSMYRIDHARCKQWIDAATSSWVELLEGVREEHDRNELVDDFRAAYRELSQTTTVLRESSEHHEELPAFEDILAYLPDSMRNTRTWEVNSRVLGQWTPENWHASHSHILVGGENLGRGFTVEGLSVTYMPRGRGGGVADTIQQRGRFFGYKRDYLGLCRVFLPGDVRTDYENYVEHESYVMEQLADLSHSEKSMAEWRRRMLLAQSLRPTRRTVLPEIYRHLRVPEWTQQEHPWGPGRYVEVAWNREVTAEFVRDLTFAEDVGSGKRTVEQRHEVASGVPLKRILDDWLVLIDLAWQDAPGFSAAQLAIQWHLQKDPNATAFVYRMAAQRRPLAGGGRRRRRTYPKQDFRIANLFQGAAPVTPARLRGSIYPGDHRIHAADEVSVQIHELDITDGKRSLLHGDVPALAVWVPDHIRVGVFEEMAP